jgi:hypothetical protein
MTDAMKLIIIVLGVGLVGTFILGVMLAMPLKAAMP